MLQYSSAFDDEVEEFPEEPSTELPSDDPEGVLECVPEEIPDLTVVDEAAAEAQPDQGGSTKQVEVGHPPASAVHGPYYYFYQGESRNLRVGSPTPLLGLGPTLLHPALCLAAAEDCQQMFLHPVNVRCLLREYGSLEASPDSITATVVEIVGHSVTEVSSRTSRIVLS